MKKKILILGTVLLMLMGSASASIITLENFDHNLNDYSGDTGSFTIDSNQQVDGNASLRGDSTGNYQDIGTYSYNWSRGDNIDFYMRYDGGQGKGYFFFGTQSKYDFPDSYFVMLNGNEDNFELSKRESGSTSTLTSTNYDWNGDEWYHFKLRTNSNEIWVEAYDSNDNLVGNLSTTDTTYSSGGYVYGVNVGGASSTKVWTDNVTLITGNSNPSIDSTTVDPDPPLIGEYVNYSAQVSDSDGTIQDTVLNITGVVSYEESRTGTSPEWNNVSDPTVEGWMNATFTVTDNDGATTTQELNRYLEDTPPNFTVVDPMNTTYTTPNVPYQVDFQDDGDSNPDEVGYCEVYNNGNLEDNVTVYETNTTSFSGTFTDLTEGSYTTEVSCTETDDGQTTNKTVDYSVVNGAPSIDNFETQPSTDWTIGDQVDVIYNLTDGFDNITWANVTVDRDGTEIASQNNLYNSDPVDEWLANFFEVTQVGNYTVKLQAEDDQNQVVTGYVNQSVPDEYPPVTTSNLTESTYYNEEIFVELTANDNASMIANLSYRTNSNDNFTTVQSDSVVFNLTGFKSYNVEYFAWDTAGNKETAKSEIVTLEALNADFFYNPDTIYTGDTVTFDGGTSSGNITQYEWDFQGDGTYDATGETVDHVFNDPDIYDVTLRVTDDEGNTDTRTQQVEVLFDSPNKTIINQCPDTPFCYEDNNSFTTENPVSVSGSFTELDENKSFEWNVNATGAGGSYDFFGFYNSTSSRLNTTEYTDIETVNISTTDVNFPPNPDFTVDISGLGIDVDASPSTDDGTITSYEWDWTSDGSYENTGLTASHTYGSDGTYDVTLRVTDNNGSTSTATKSVSVSSTTDGGDDGDDGTGGGGIDPGDDASVDGTNLTLLAPHRNARYTNSQTDVLTIEEGESTTIVVNGSEQTLEVASVEDQRNAEIIVNGVQQQFSESNTLFTYTDNQITYNELELTVVRDVVKTNSSGFVYFTLGEGAPTEVPLGVEYQVNGSAEIDLQYRKTGFGNNWQSAKLLDINQDVEYNYTAPLESLDHGIYEVRAVLNASGNTSRTDPKGLYVGDAPSINITNPENFETFTSSPNGQIYQLPLDFKAQTLNRTTFGTYYVNQGSGKYYGSGTLDSLESEQTTDLFDIIVKAVINSFVTIFLEGDEEFKSLYTSFYVPEETTFTGQSTVRVGEFGTFNGYVNASSNYTANIPAWNTTSVPVVVQLNPSSVENETDDLASEVLDEGQDLGDISELHRNDSINKGVDTDGDGSNEFILDSAYFQAVEPVANENIGLVNLDEENIEFSFLMGYNISNVQDQNAILNKSIVITAPDNSTTEIGLDPTTAKYADIQVRPEWLNDGSWKTGLYEWHAEFKANGQTVYTTENKVNGTAKFNVEQRLPRNPLRLGRYLVTEVKESLESELAIPVFVSGLIMTLLLMALPMIPLLWIGRSTLAILSGVLMYLVAILFYVPPAFLVVATGIGVLLYTAKWVSDALGGST